MPGPIEPYMLVEKLTANRHTGNSAHYTRHRVYVTCYQVADYSHIISGNNGDDIVGASDHIYRGYTW